MADLVTQYPTTPSFNAVNFKVNTPTIATTTFSGKSRRTGYGHQFYEFEVQYPTITPGQLATVQGYLARSYGSQLSFEIVLPEISYTSLAAQTSSTPRTTTGYSKGVKTVNLTNCGANQPVLNIGDFFKFNGHSKVYQAIQSVTADSGGNATLSFAGSLVEDVGSAEDLVITAVPFTVINLNNVQQFEIGIGGLATASVSMRETW